MPNYTKDELDDYNTELRNRRQRIRILEAELDGAKKVVKSDREDLEEAMFGLLRYIDGFNQELPLLDGGEEGVLFYLRTSTAMASKLACQQTRNAAS